MPIFDNIATPLTAFKALAQQAFTTTTNGIGIPLKGLISLAWFFNCTAYTSGTMTFKIQVSDDNVTFVDLDEKYVIRPDAPVQITAVDQIVKIGISGVDEQTQKYARIVTLGTVVLSGNAIAIADTDNR